MVFKTFILITLSLLLNTQSICLWNFSELPFRSAFVAAPSSGLSLALSEELRQFQRLPDKLALQIFDKIYDVFPVFLYELRTLVSTFSHVVWRLLGTFECWGAIAGFFEGNSTFCQR